MMLPIIKGEPYLIALLLITLTQILYYLIFFRKLAFYKKEDRYTSSSEPVSVIVCARDEADNLVHNLPGVLVQHYDAPHEILVVNDNSMDESRYLLDEFKKSFASLKTIELTQEAKLISGKKFPLSIGIKSAKNEVLLLTDADCMPASENWICKMQEPYSNSKIEIVLGYGAYKKCKGILNKIIRFETFHTAIQYLSYALAGIPYMGVGRNLSYKKTVFLRNKGFASINRQPGGDDDLFINQVANSQNTAIMIDPESITLSTPKKTWKAWRKQKGRHYTTSRHYRSLHKFLLGLYNLSHLLFYPSLVLALIFSCWWMALSAYGLRLLIEMIIFSKGMKKLNEKDLWPFIPLWDIWLMIQNLLFFPSLIKKPRETWN